MLCHGSKFGGGGRNDRWGTALQLLRVSCGIGDCVLRAYSRRDSTTASGRWTHTGYQRRAVGKAQDTRCLIITSHSADVDSNMGLSPVFSNMLRVELEYTTFRAAYVWLEFSAGRRFFSSAGGTVCAITTALTGVFALFSEIASWFDAVLLASAGTTSCPVRLGNGSAIIQVYGLTKGMSALGIGPVLTRFIYQRAAWTALVLLLASVSIASTIPTALWMGREVKRWPGGREGEKDVGEQEEDVTYASQF
ncbi:uncharacterized protein AFUA_1G00130 [Aspergillus fumigatus Af293]|uniref:Uncharacterized protein n=1 Tax=Aspergillus fumigatus (strain ATCC MYA-4609 / CBS 101355 / FGSC A1100 / Af293) TaxID=330879 RepID=Q4WL55_ASPFU|nr:hypothetical protein AFUA_1G00130 [Aspergillus fumigatus Af293]EAL87727.1 hypothetical protein AFUA_1G00130 [Aspergillus fumigatus Af293]